MKSAYELAMERLRQQAPEHRLNADQKKALAEIESLFAAKIAEKDLAHQAEVSRRQAAGDFEGADEIRQRFSSEKRSLEREREERKQAVRAEATS